MLGFTHDSRKTNTKDHFYQQQQQFQPIIIHNGGNGTQKPMPQPTHSQKKIVKTHSNHHRKEIKSGTKSSHKSIRRTENKPWNDQTVTDRKQAGLFDKQMQKDSLAREERRMKAQVKQKQEQVGDSCHHHILSKQQEMHMKKMNTLQQQKDKEIQKLKAMIEKERVEKEKADREYEEKKKKIEEERKQLIQLERQIQKQGPKVAKQLKQKVRISEPEIYPGSDRAKCRPEPREYQGRGDNVPFNQITQSQSIANQKNKLRQQQLSYLVEQRERNHQQYQKNTLGYTPTIIPLLSKASYKIISTHISTLVQLFIDEMLEEQVHVLESIELAERAEKEKEKQKNVIRDYVDKLEDFVDEAEIIEEKVGKYSQMRFEDIYRLPQAQHRSRSVHGFSYQPNLYQSLSLNMSNDQLEQIESRVDRFKRFVSSFDEYKPANMRMFEACTQEIINDALMKLAKELDNGSGEFVQLVFRSEFE